MCAPAAFTPSATALSWGCDSTEHGPAITTICGPPTGTPCTLNWVLSGCASRLASLKGWRMRTTLSTESRDCSASSCSFARSSPTTPMIVRTSPRERWVRNPKSLTRRETSSMSSSLDPGFSTMIIGVLLHVCFLSFVCGAGCCRLLLVFRLWCVLLPFTSCLSFVVRVAAVYFLSFVCGACCCRLVLQALHLRGPGNGPRTPPAGGHRAARDTGK